MPEWVDRLSVSTNNQTLKPGCNKLMWRFVVWANWKKNSCNHYFESPQWVTWVSLKMPFESSLPSCAHKHKLTHLLILLSPFVHKPLLHPSHLFPHVPLLHLPLFLPSAMQQLFIDNNDQWEQVLWESSHPGAQGTQHTSSSPACQSLPHILQ